MPLLAKALRVLLLSLLSVVISLLLGAFILTSALRQTALDKDTFKSWVAQPEMYELVKSNAADQFVESGTNNNDPEQVQAVENLVNEHIDTDFYTKATSTIVDASFAWIYGEDDFQFEIKIFDSQEEFRAFLAEALYEKQKTLPVCDSTASMAEAVEDPFGAECRLPDITNEQLSQYIDEAEKDGEFNELYQNATVSSKSLGYDEPSPELQDFRDNVQLIAVMPWLLAFTVTAVLAFELLIFRNVRRWMKFVGLQLMGSTVATLLAIFLVRWVDPLRNLDSQMSQNDNFINASVLVKIIDRVAGDILGALLLVTGIIFIIGALMFGGSLYWKHRSLRSPSEEIEDKSPSFVDKQ